MVTMPRSTRSSSAAAAEPSSRSLSSNSNRMKSTGPATSWSVLMQALRGREIGRGSVPEPRHGPDLVHTTVCVVYRDTSHSVPRLSLPHPVGVDARVVS